MSEASRAQFEAWISAPPYEHMCDRNSDSSPWPGQYKRYETQLAWEAWQKSAQQEREACIEDVRTVGGSFAIQCEDLIRARKGEM